MRIAFMGRIEVYCIIVSSMRIGDDFEISLLH